MTVLLIAHLIPHVPLLSIRRQRLQDGLALPVAQRLERSEIA